MVDLVPVDSAELSLGVSIANAVEAEYDAQLDGNGAIENAVENITALSRVVGVLVQSLYEQSLIDDQLLLIDILNGGYKIKKE